MPPPDLAGVVSGQRRFGHGLTSLLAVLREEADCRKSADVAMIAVGVVKRHGKVDILFKDAGFALIDFAALLRFRCASQNLGSTGGFSVCAFR